MVDEHFRHGAECYPDFCPPSCGLIWIDFFDCAGTPFRPIALSGFGGVFTAALSATMKRCCASWSLNWSSSRAVGVLPMTENPNWPGGLLKKDSILAIGTVSVNYSRLEFAMTAMFATITGCSMQFATILIPKITNQYRIDLMERMLAIRSWPDDVRAGCERFIGGFKILADNRNLLMHSSMEASTREPTLLYKVTKQGNTELCQVSPGELRQIADDMTTYSRYGLHLSNVINIELLGVKPQAGDFGALPDMPPLPTPLKYSGRPLQGP
jgi:hypothetical protein